MKILVPVQAWIIGASAHRQPFGQEPTRVNAGNLDRMLRHQVIQVMEFALPAGGIWQQWYLMEADEIDISGALGCRRQ
jgi:hypothetical protein